MTASARRTWQTSSTVSVSSMNGTRDGIEVKGRAAHAMIPEEGINAIARLCTALNAIGIQSNAIDFVAREIGQDPYATRIFGDIADEPSGKLKFNVGKIDLRMTEQLSIDIRIPVTFSREEVVNPLVKAAAKYGLEYKELTGWDRSICHWTISWSQP